MTLPAGRLISVLAFIRKGKAAAATAQVETLVLPRHDESAAARLASTKDHTQMFQPWMRTLFCLLKKQSWSQTALCSNRRRWEAGGTQHTAPQSILFPFWFYYDLLPGKSLGINSAARHRCWVNICSAIKLHARHVRFIDASRGNLSKGVCNSLFKQKKNTDTGGLTGRGEISKKKN